MTRKIFELRTVQTSVFKTLVEALKELLTDTVIEFDSEGMKIITTDTAHVILVHLPASSRPTCARGRRSRWAST